MEIFIAVSTMRLAVVIKVRFNCIVSRLLGERAHGLYVCCFQTKPPKMWACLYAANNFLLPLDAEAKQPRIGRRSRKITWETKECPQKCASFSRATMPHFSIKTHSWPPPVFQPFVVLQADILCLLPKVINDNGQARVVNLACVLPFEFWLLFLH